MNLFRGFWAILLKEFTVIFRDPTTLFFMFFPPLTQLIAFGYALDTDVKNMKNNVVGSRKMTVNSFNKMAQKPRNRFIVFLR